MKLNDRGVSEIISTILMVALVVALGALIGAFAFGFANPLHTTVYMVTQAVPIPLPGGSVVELAHSGGESVSLAPDTTHGRPVKITLSNGTVTYAAVPLQPAMAKAWGPGSRICLFRNASGVWLANSTDSVQGNLGFSPGVWTVNIVDTTASTLIAQHTVTLIGNASSSPPVVFTRYPGFTVEAWVKWNIPPSSVPDWATIVVDGTSDGNRRYHLQHYTKNKNFEFALGTVNGIRAQVPSTTTPGKGTWYHVTGVYNQTPGTMAIYVNGVNQNNRNVDSSGLCASPGRYQVGGPAGITWGSPGQRIFNGEIRGLITSEQALSPQEIAAHAAAGHP